MKNMFLATAALAAVSLSARAGRLTGVTLSGAPLVTVVGGYNQPGDLEADVSVTNNTGRTLRMRVQRQVITEVTGSENYFCTSFNCYTPFVSTSPVTEIVNVNNGDTDTGCHFYYTPNGQPGITTIRYAVFETGGQDSAYVTVRFDASRPLGSVAGAATERLLSQPFPNPAAAGTAPELRYHLPAGVGAASLVVVAVADGRRVRQLVVTFAEGRVRIPTEQLAAGLYSCLLFSGADGRGQLLAARRLQVQ